ncbi:hypothetical protein [Adhaeribacter pallidiroseus]|uniref:Uncharacterized protein n=1 Tax=Adhaeribacter pallidiroseus TaxID=2072847 RepID=A0A369QRC0_9BACT|nr:hypothetical protein [Adhaeribacter pallidiroseus]RDC66215.1 hypothetical protein AHMF7616_04846 [Adhaeribacter pallidiroseus]
MNNRVVKRQSLHVAEAVCCIVGEQIFKFLKYLSIHGVIQEEPI